jgi:hypothetical protein
MPSWSLRRKAFVLGGVGFYVALSPLSEFAFGRIGLVPIVLLVYLLLIRLYLRRTRPIGPGSPLPGLVPTIPPGAVGRT